MALKVVPAGDERCDIHNRRSPQKYVCEACLKEFGIDPDESATVHRPPRRVRWRRARRRWRSRITWRVVLGAAVIVILVLVVSPPSGCSTAGWRRGRKRAPVGGRCSRGARPAPNPSGSGWITSDGACAVVAIDRIALPPPPQEGEQLSIEASNEDRTVVAIVIQNDFSLSQAECVGRVDAALKAEF